MATEWVRLRGFSAASGGMFTPEMGAWYERAPEHARADSLRLGTVAGVTVVEIRQAGQPLTWRQIPPYSDLFPVDSSG